MSQSKRRATAAMTGVSWMALLAAATVGMGQLSTVRAQVMGRGAPLRADAVGGLRLVVQSYDQLSVAGGELPRRGARALAAMQRAVTAEELRSGVWVDVLQVGGSGSTSLAPVVVAWVEAGPPDLEFGALTARPAPGAVYGVSRPVSRGGSGSARVVLARLLG